MYLTIEKAGTQNSAGSQSQEKSGGRQTERITVNEYPRNTAS
jgi:hypothetical protein